MNKCRLCLKWTFPNIVQARRLPVKIFLCVHALTVAAQVRQRIYICRTRAATIIKKTQKFPRQGGIILIDCHAFVYHATHEAASGTCNPDGGYA